MGEKNEIISNERIKPSSPTPNHLHNFKLSFLDQLAPSFYVPILLFYSASDVRTFATDLTALSEKLKTSLSKLLTLYYPFCGRLRGNSTIDCNDQGVIFIHSKLPIPLSNILKNPKPHNLHQLLPCAPYNLQPQQRDTLGIMAVQLSQFKCGGIALGVCFSHKIIDASTAASFLSAWAATSRGHGNSSFAPPPMEETSLLFPPRNVFVDMTSGMFGHANTVTKRFIFSGSNISRLRQNIGCPSFNPSRVEAVTALLWKSSLEAAKEGSDSGEENVAASSVCHIVNIRSRMVPALSKDSIGNIWQYAVSSLVEVEGGVGLRDLAERVRETIRKVDGDYIRKLQSDVEFVEVVKGLEEARTMAAEKGHRFCAFTSWVGFGFYEVDFGWGKPTYATTIGMPIKNLGVLISTKDGEGIEAWLTLTTREMAQLEHNAQLLDFASLDS
ncbi:hypothetical protein PHAVU_010G020900 [Phaseolus vulgaris]|uniref:Uncharacterized protein n=1 Tax=Phaseolus vulgaris TaxID=3885 RepID=V7API0_PHAVU|nr:hypothetical protein PHAVU_010G020900g [Phaseolus vulgaris]ESW06116.1 hypothetical protein PHAVU_010G020900g [Phaseolus vulgaris]